MRRATSPIGPLIAIALLCAAAPLRAEENRDADAGGPAGEAAVGHDVLGAVDPSAWRFLDPPQSVQSEDLAAPATPASGLDGGAPEAPLSAEERAQLEQALQSNPEVPGTKSGALRARAKPAPASDNLDVTRTGQANGMSTVMFKKPITAGLDEWKARVGADLGMTDDSSTSPLRPLPAQRDTRGANAAWASIDYRDFVTVDARVNPAGEQNTLATTLKHTMPIGSDLSLILQSRTAMKDSYGPGLINSDVPLMTLPATVDGGTSRVLNREDMMKFSILSTGTTLRAAVSSSSIDTATHHTLGAEQKLYGPWSLSTAITDAGQPNENRSVTAKAKFSW